VKCPIFRSAKWIETIVAAEMCGSSQSRKGTRKRDVCSADNTSLEPTNIKNIQAMTGIHLLTNRRALMFKRSTHCTGNVRTHKVGDAFRLGSTGYTACPLGSLPRRSLRRIRHAKLLPTSCRHLWASAPRAPEKGARGIPAATVSLGR
jgi:hypothetical protein